VEEKRLVVSGVFQCFHFREKRGWGSAHIGRGKEHAGRLLVPSWPTAGVGSKGCLGHILLWISNRLPKWTGLGKTDAWTERKLWRQIWAAVVEIFFPNF
jgi:hypothetical protein